MTLPTQSQWLREAQVLIGTAESAIDVSELHFRFEVKRGDTQTPNSASIKLWNPSDTTARKIQALEEYGRILISAGYEGTGKGLIFDGTIRQVIRGRDNATDTYVEVLASTLDQAYNFAVVNVSFAAGSKPADHINAAVGAMQPFGATLGYVPPLPKNPLPRGKVMFGMCRDLLRNTAKTCGVSYSLQDNTVQFVAQDSYIPGTVVELNSHTGLIGLPQQTINGIQLRCLLNAKLKIGSAIKLNNASIQGFRANLNYSDPLYSVDTFKTTVPQADADGLYRILVISHSGDTRGQDWYSDIVCIGINSDLPLPFQTNGYLGETQATPVQPYG